jgi:glycosyltransferase involved in cell wall biosynthesis
MPDLTVIILTLNEALHIERCIRNAQRVTRTVVVVDSGSTDGTSDIAAALGARVLQNPWVNYAMQINWALQHADIRTEWVMRLDADEYMDEALQRSLLETLNSAAPDISGFDVKRYVIFQGRLIRYGGGASPVRELRVWRHGNALCNDCWMDEHIVLRQGRCGFVKGALVDHNLRSLTWWTQKHNGYASREAVELLNLEYGIRADGPIPRGMSLFPKTKRVLRNQLYSRLPVGLRPMLYFFYRYVLRLGFLDGLPGLTFHVLQGFWYRFLADMKVVEVKRYMRSANCDVRTAVNAMLSIDVSATTRRRD